jgi:hypothetical protein
MQAAMWKRAGFLSLPPRFRYGQAVTVEGLVTNTVTHCPIPEVAVELTAVDAREPAYRAIMDAAAAFRIARAEPATYQVS